MRGTKSKFVEIRVGLFVSACIGIFVLAIIYISSGSAIFGPTFQAVTYLPTVGGLKAGAPVQLAGVEVGTVVRVDILAPELEPKNTTNTQIYAQLRQTREEIAERKNKIPELEKEMKPLSEKRQRLIQNKKENSAEFKALENKMDELRLSIETHNNKIGDLTSRIEILLQTIQNVQVIMKIEHTYKNWLRKDSSVGVGSIGLLGDKYIDISLGRSEFPPETNDKNMVVITGKKETDFREIITGIDDLVGNFGVLSQRFRNLTNKMEEGTVAQFIGDRSFYDNLNSTIKEAEHTLKASTELLQEVKGGKGTVGRLISEDRLYKDINATTARANEILEKINSAQGVLGKLINDDTLYKKADSMIESADVIAARIKNGQGTLGKLSQDEALYEQTRVTMQKLSGIIDDLEKGQGTMGKLIKDKTLYDNLNQTSAELVKLLYDFRQDPKKYLTIRFRLF